MAVPLDVGWPNRGGFLSLRMILAKTGESFVARDAAAAGRPVRIGDPVTVNDQVLTVIGLLDRPPRSASSIGLLGPAVRSPLLGLDLNRSAVVPFRAARRVMLDAKVTHVAARLAPGADDRAPVRPTGRPSRRDRPRRSPAIPTARGKPRARPAFPSA